MLQAQQTAVQVDQGVILLADDDEILLSIHKEILEDMGYRVITASHGVEAIEQYKKYKNDISLAIFDVVMPFVTGPEAAIYIAALDGALPIIFVTGCDSHESLKQVSIPQGFCVITKPVNFDVFADIVHDMLAVSTACA